MQQTAARVLAVLVLLSGTAAPRAALAAGPSKGGKHGKGGDSASLSGGAALPAASLAKLKSDDPMEVRAGLDDARLAGPKATAAVPLITALLGSGLPYALAEAAIDTLADIESPEAAAAIIPYARHRDVKVRRAAVRALGKTVPGPGAPLAAAALRTALSDPDSNVRASAATGLGALKTKGAVPDLFLALDHRVYEAAVSIGQLCDAGDCNALMSRMGSVPFDVITTGVDQLLFRPASEVSDDAKIGVIHKVRDAGTKDANVFLRGVQGRWPKTGSPAVKREIDAAILATLSSPGGEK